MSCKLIEDFVNVKVTIYEGENLILGIIEKIEALYNSLTGSLSSMVTGAMSNMEGSPLMALGEDYLAQQVATNSSQLLGNITNQIKSKLGEKFNDMLQAALDSIFNTIALALTAQNDFALLLLQSLASRIVKEIDEKDKILKEVNNNLTSLFNALKILTAGDPFFSEYLKNLRKALILLDAAEKKILLVRNTLAAKDIWLSTNFRDAQTLLVEAEKLITPPKQTSDSINLKDGIQPTNDLRKLLDNVGLPTKSEQLTVMLSIPILAQKTATSMSRYLERTFLINTLVLSFIQGMDAFTKSSSSMLKKCTISSLDAILDRIAILNDDLALNINGDLDGVPLRIRPADNFKPKPIRISAQGVKWIVELQVLEQMTRIVPGKTFERLETSNKALETYQKACADIKKLTTRTRGAAVIIVNQGREEPGLLEQQIVTFTFSALRAMIDAKVADNILALGKTTIARVQLSQELDRDLRTILNNFANADLGIKQALKDIRDSINKLLLSSGLDRAQQLLELGKFDEFFNLNSKTATFAGAALLGLALIKDCLKDSDAKAATEKAEQTILREVKAKELLAARQSPSKWAVQIEQNNDAIKKLQGLKDSMCNMSFLCGILDSIGATNMLKKLTSELGL